MSVIRRPLILAAAAAAVLAALTPAAVRAEQPASPLRQVRHVWTIVLENEEFARTFVAGQAEAPYLTRTLLPSGAFVPNYYGTGHSSLDNYIAMTSGQGPDPQTQGDCNDASTMVVDHVDANGQAVAKAAGCTYPATVKSIGDQLNAAGVSWKAYAQDMDAAPATRRTTCQGPFTVHLLPGAAPGNPKSPDDYAAKHNPFVYYHSIFDNLASCDAHDVPLTGFTADLQKAGTTPMFNFVVPNLCDDGHDMPTCSDGSVGGPSKYDAFLQKYVPQIEASKAFKRNGLIVILFDEGETGLSCCGETTAPNIPSGSSNGQPWPAPIGMGGGQTGAVLISPFIKPGTISTQSYNHYSYLRSMEDVFGLGHLGYANQSGVVSFGSDVFGPGALTLP